MNRGVYVICEKTEGWDWEGIDIVCAVNNEQEAEKMVNYLNSNIDREADRKIDIYWREYYWDHCPLVNSLEELRGDGDA